MTLCITTSFSIPPALGRITRLAGLELLSQGGLGKHELEAFVNVDEGIWADAQVAARSAFIAVRDSKATPVPAACRLLGIDDKFGRDALAQWLSQDALYRLNFVHICRHAFPDAVTIVDFPPGLVSALEEAGFQFHRGLSRAAWVIRRLCLTAKALIAHGAHFLLRIRDEMRPGTLGLADDSPVVLWASICDGELGQAEDALNVSDFVAARGDLFPPDETVICEGNPATRHAPPVKVAADLFPLRRTGRSGTGALINDLILQFRLARSVAVGGWVEVMMGWECAKLPRARACLTDLKPGTIYCTIAQLHYLSLWFALARQAGAPVRVFCTSTQIFPIRSGPAPSTIIVPDIYMLLSADEYLVWDEAHAADMSTAGATSETIRTIGPVILSGNVPPDSGKGGTEGAITIDYFDQPPCSRRKLIRMGNPGIYHTPERLIAALDDVVAAAKTAFTGRDWTLRIKTKRALSDQEDGGYALHIADLARRHPNLMLVDPATSPLFLHGDSTATIGFPFVSPVVSAIAAGVDGAFYDPDAGIHQLDVARDIPILCGRAALTDWLNMAALPADKGPANAAVGGRTA